MKKLPLMWKWSMRDMRQRWLQVVGISLIIALGVALSSGLGSSVPWRIKSFDESYAMLKMFDLKMELTSGSYLDTQRLTQTVEAIPHAEWIEAIEARLTFPTSVDASTSQEYLLASGRVIGVDTSAGGPDVNKLHITAGRNLGPDDAGVLTCIVEQNFASYHELEPGDRPLGISGGHTLEQVGTAISAEHFMVVDEDSGVLGAMAQDRYVALFVPLQTAQEIAGLPGAANELLLTVSDGLGEDGLDQLKTEIENQMARAHPEVGVSLEKRSEDLSYRVLQDDITSDQELFDTISSLLLLGAAFGAFILIGRVVDAQRREIGINMALGVPPLRIARRYLLIGTQIALLGTVFGVGFGVLINQPLANEFNKLMPLPYTDYSFQEDLFMQSALIGILIPFAAVLFPIWRAIRVAPIDAIQTGYHVSKGGGLAPFMARLPLPGSSFALFPVRNLSRGLRRTVMTVLGLSMAITVLIAVIGMIDTLSATLDAGGREIKKGAPARTMVTLDDFYPLEGPLVSEIATSENVAQAVPSVMLPGQLMGDDKFDVVIQLMDLDNDLWTPTILRGSGSSDNPGVLINEKAARDLGVGVGDTVSLVYPLRESRHAWRLAQIPVQVMGIHADILRIAVYMDIKDAAALNLDGIVNNLYINPAPGIEVKELQRTLTQTKGVALVRGVAENLDSIEELLDQYLSIFMIIQFVVLIMAFLVAFNTTRSNMDERRRDLATMFAFGTRVRTAIRMAMVENLITGILGTAVGIGFGWFFLSSTLLAMFERDAPELNTVLSVSASTYGWAVLIGVVIVSVTPLLMARRLAKMDIPSTLRVIE